MLCFRDIAKAAVAALSISLALATTATTATAAAPASCPAGMQPRTLYLADFETKASQGTGPAGWQARRLLPSSAGAGIPEAEGQLNESHWHYPPPAPGNQPWGGMRNIWADTFPAGEVPERAGSSAIEMEGDVAIPADARLSFIHRFDFTAVSKPDGEPATVIEKFGAGTVEFSTDGRPWGDARTFTGSVTSHRSSHLNLEEMAGKRLRLRFLLTTVAPPPGIQPPVGGFRGWAIDDVHIYRCVSQSDEKKPPQPANGASPDATARNLTSPLNVFVARRPARLRRGSGANLRVAITNVSGRTLRRVRVCFRAPRRILVGARCAVIRRLPSSATADISFRVNVSSGAPKRRKRVKVNFVARTKGIAVATAFRRYRLGPG